MIVIRRSSDLLNGQAIAVRVNGDPDGANDGLFYPSEATTATTWAAPVS